MKISTTELRSKIISLLSKNFSDQESERIADYLLWADMSGISTQGVIKLTGTEPLQNIQPSGEVKIERETKLSALLDGNKNPAPLVAQQATDIVIEKAKENGFAIVGAHNTFSSNGAQAYYVERIAKEDLIGIVMSRSPGSTAPFNSIDPLFGTNPIGFGFPTNGEPLVFDMATSAMTWYGLVLAKSKGEKIPEGLAINKNGELTQDSGEVMGGGALLPFDKSYKSSGIGMVVEIMAGPLAASAYCDCETFDKEWGSTFIAIDPNLLVDIDKFKASCTDLINIIKKSRTKNPDEKIRLPGERARKAYNDSQAFGVVEVDSTIYDKLV